MTDWTPPPDGVSTAARIFAALDHHAVDGVVGLPLRQIARHAGMSMRQTSVWLAKLRAMGAIQAEAHGNSASPTAYRIADRTAVSFEIVKPWTREREALVRDHYANTKIDILLARVNETTGPRVSRMALRSYAVGLGLHQNLSEVRAPWNKGLRTAPPKPKKRAAVPKPVVSWRTPEGIARFKELRDAGVTNGKIAAAFGMAISTVERYCAELGLPPREAGAPKAVAPPAPDIRRYGFNKSLVSVFSYRTLPIGFRNHPPPPPHEPGRCQWVLSCGEPTEGKYCAEHDGLRRRAARRGVAADA